MLSVPAGTFERMSEPQQQSDDQASATQASDTQGEVLGSPTPESGAERDPQEWVTGEEPMTGPQRSYLDTLARKAGEEIPANLTKAEASEHIERLQAKVDQ